MLHLRLIVVICLNNLLLRPLLGSRVKRREIWVVIVVLVLRRVLKVIIRILKKIAAVVAVLRKVMMRLNNRGGRRLRMKRLRMRLIISQLHSLRSLRRCSRFQHIYLLRLINLGQDLQLELKKLRNLLLVVVVIMWIKMLVRKGKNSLREGGGGEKRKIIEKKLWV